MRLSARGVARGAVLSFVVSLLLVFMLAIMANGLAAAEVSLRAVEVVGFVVAFLAYTYAAFAGGRRARKDDLDVKSVVASAVVGLALGYVVLELANSFTEVVLLGRELTMSWSMLYGVLLWLPPALVGGWLATRGRARRRRRIRT